MQRMIVYIEIGYRDSTVLSDTKEKRQGGAANSTRGGYSGKCSSDERSLKIGLDWSKLRGIK
eukprot:IDg19687t1